MKCTAYYEENDIIGYDKYEKAVDNLLSKGNVIASLDSTIRKANFGNDKMMNGNNGRNSFCICMKDFMQNEIYLEKKTVENNRVFKSHVKISKREAEKILFGNIQWMKNSKKTIIRDFYLESEINELKLMTISEVKKDVFCQEKGLDGIVFKTSIRSTQIDTYSTQMFFDEKLPMVDDLNCDSILYSYRRYIHIPTAVSSITNMYSYNKEAAYSL